MLLCLITSTNAMTIVCQFFYNAVESSTEDQYGCYPTTVDLGNSVVVESVTGTHRPGRTNDDVTYLMLLNQNVPQFPKELEKFFPNLRFFRISETGLLSIKAEDLKPYPQITMLYIGANKFTSLDGDLFTLTPNLQWINIDRCKITSIGRGLLDNLDDLTYIDLQHNPCIDLRAQNREQVLELKPSLLTLCPPNCTCEPRKLKYQKRPSRKFTFSVAKDDLFRGKLNSCFSNRKILEKL